MFDGFDGSDKELSGKQIACSQQACIDSSANIPRLYDPIEVTNYDRPRGERLSNPCICLCHLTEKQQDIDRTLAWLRLGDRSVLENREQGGREWVEDTLADKHPAEIVSRSRRLFGREISRSIGATVASSPEDQRHCRSPRVRRG